MMKDLKMRNLSGLAGFTVMRGAAAPAETDAADIEPNLKRHEHDQH